MNVSSACAREGVGMEKGRGMGKIELESEQARNWADKNESVNQCLQKP